MAKKQIETVADLKEFIGEIAVDITFQGATGEFNKELHLRAGKIGAEICTENKMTAEEARGLPGTTKLGESSKLLANEMKAWYDAKS